VETRATHSSKGMQGAHGCVKRQNYSLCCVVSTCGDAQCLDFLWQLLLTEPLVSEMAPKSPSQIVAASAVCKHGLLGHYTYLVIHVVDCIEAHLLPALFVLQDPSHKSLFKNFISPTHLD